MAHLWNETEKETLSQGMDDMDPESDVEQLRLLPPDERRKALRQVELFSCFPLPFQPQLRLAFPKGSD